MGTIPKSVVVEPTGYGHPAYAASLSEVGTPRLLPRSAGWLLERIPRQGCRDAMGCYPLFCCRDWGQLRADLDELRGLLVSVVLVTDPFGEYDEELLQRSFDDVVRPYKHHFVADLRQAPEAFVHRHHQRKVRAALLRLGVERCETPTAFLDEWTLLYRGLIERHRISSIGAFSRQAFERQLAVPGIVAFRASAQGETHGMSLWYVQGDVAYYHLGASSAAGYESGAAFALFWRAMKHFREAGVYWLDFGAGAGAQSTSDDGLTRFKRGLSTGTRTAYLCGSVLDSDGYRVLAESAGDTSYFPSYREGEFDQFGEVPPRT